MPIYEYHCPKCYKDFEELVFGNAAPPCPTCGGNAAPSRVGQVMKYPTSGRSACGSCSGGNCSSCK